MLLHRDLSEKVIKCFFNVYNELGNGFLESVYEKALLIELRENNINASDQKELSVYYKKNMVGQFRADIIVDDKLLIEIKAVSKLNGQHEAQVLNYLKATGIKVGLLVNFGIKLEFKRLIY